MPKFYKVDAEDQDFSTYFFSSCDVQLHCFAVHSWIIRHHLLAFDA